MRNFREIRVWKLGIELTKEIYKISQKLPETEKYGLCSQNVKVRSFNTV
jgi:four helix bundle protein